MQVNVTKQHTMTLDNETFDESIKTTTQRTHIHSSGGISCHVGPEGPNIVVGLHIMQIQ